MFYKIFPLRCHKTVFFVLVITLDNAKKEVFRCVEDITNYDLDIQDTESVDRLDVLFIGVL